MESNQIKFYQEMSVLDIFRKALLVSSKNINFIIFAFITSLPLFCFVVYYEFSFQKFLLQTFEILEVSKGHFSFNMHSELKKDYLHEMTRMGLLYFVPYNLLQLSTVLLIVDLASKIYKEDKQMSLKDMLPKPMISLGRLRGTLITFLNFLDVSLLSTCTLLGFIWLVTISNDFSSDLILMAGIFPTAVLGGAFVALLTLYLALSAVWNMSIVFSILEGVYGTEALAMSSYCIGGKDECGIVLMLVFSVWEIGLRFPCLYIGCYKGGYGIIAQVSLFCLGMTLKWIVFVVYYHSLKEITLAKKVDLEVGTEVRPVG